jgi:hypothetical protein
MQRPFNSPLSPFPDYPKGIAYPAHRQRNSGDNAGVRRARPWASPRFDQPMEEHMKPILRKTGIAFAGLTLIVGVLAAGTGLAIAGATKVTLSGAQEVPPVQTSATGSGTITVNDDKSVSGSVTTKGVKGTMAHIHEGAPGKNGGVAIPLEKKSDNEWAVPAGAKLTDAQYKSYKAGDLYVNVHSDANKGGEIRGQLKP